MARDADANPADRPGMVAPRLAAPPAVRTADGLAPLSGGDGDRETAETISAVARKAAAERWAQCWIGGAPERTGTGIDAVADAVVQAVTPLIERAAAGDTAASRRTLAPHGLTAAQVIAAVRNILDTGHPDSAAPLLWAVRDYVPGTSSRRRAARGTR